LVLPTAQGLPPGGRILTEEILRWTTAQCIALAGRLDARNGNAFHQSQLAAQEELLHHTMVLPFWIRLLHR
ncbi:MAG TPA: hypothetical protein VGN88_13995, partial [Phycisphaerae bacterium]